MTPEQATAMYRRAIANFELVTIRIYSGTGGSRTSVDHDDVQARPVNFDPEELVGPIVQGDRNLIILAEDVPAGVTLTMGANCKIVIRGKELQIKSIDDSTRRCRGTLIAYDLVVGG